MIPQFSLTAQHAALRPQIDEAIAQVVFSGRFVGGEEVERFEEEWARYCGAKHCVSTASGTSALAIAIRACGFEPDDGNDPITLPALTFVATGEAIVHAGRRPHFMDIDAGSFLGPAGHCDVAVALYGEPIDSGSDQRGYRGKILDACQAHGARFDWSQWWAGCFSFYPGKNLGCLGDGGAIVTNDANLAASARSLRNHGIDLAKGTTDPVHLRVGWNSRLDAIQAAVLRVKLPHLDDWTAARRHRAAFYRSLLSGVDGITLPANTPGHAVHQFVIRVHDGRRDELRAHLAAEGIEARCHYARAVHQHPAFASYASGPMPNAERAASEVLSLPMFPELALSDVETVGESVRRFFR